MSVDYFPPDTIVMNKSPTQNMEKVTDDNIRKIISNYYTPTISESSKGVVVTFSPKGDMGSESIVWYERGKSGFRRKPISTNEWMMVDCDFKGIHELLNNNFQITEGDFNVVRNTLSKISHEVVRSLYSNPKTHC